MRTEELQRRLAALGFDAGPFDGIYGELTEDAIFDALDMYAPAVEMEAGLIPPEWLPPADMTRIILHWTAGAHKASAHDLNYYHLLIEDDGRLVRGTYSIKDNVYTGDGKYAAHTKGCNSNSIGISLCAMANATENPFDPGKFPVTEKQRHTLTAVAAELCHTYGIKVSRETTLTHAEVERNLGIAQSGKWDITWLPGMAKPHTAIATGDLLRTDIKQRISS